VVNPIIAWTRDATQVASGRIVYEQFCAASHGVKLEGQPN
jgi:cytochrome c5